MISFPSSINQGGSSNILYDKAGNRVYVTDDNISSFDVSRIKAMNHNLNPTIKQEMLNDENLDISMNSYRIRPRKFVNSGVTQLQAQGGDNAVDNEFMTWAENPFTIPSPILSTMNKYTRVYKTPVNNLMNAGAEQEEVAEKETTQQTTEPNGEQQAGAQGTGENQSTNATPPKRTIPDNVEVTGLKTKVVSSIFNPIHVIQVAGLLDNMPLLNVKTNENVQDVQLNSYLSYVITNNLNKTESVNGTRLDEKGNAVENTNTVKDFYDSFMLKPEDLKDTNKSGMWTSGGTAYVRIKYNPFNEALIDNSANCTIRELVNKSHTPNGELGMAKYKYADFLFCKNIGKVSNNHMITLRRFAHPVGDNIFRYAGKGYLNRRMPNYHGFQENASIGTLISWFGTDDNKIEDILNYSVQSTWKEFNAEIREIDSKEDEAAGGLIGMFANSFNPAYNSLVAKGMAGSNALWQKGASTIFGGVIGKAYAAVGGSAQSFGTNSNSMEQWNLMRVGADHNKIYTPQNTVQSTHKYEGKLVLQHEFTLNFSYRLRALDVMNPKAVMLDLIGNILEVTYNRGHFWGGENRFIGPPRNSSGIATANAFIDRQWEKLEGFMQGFANGSIDWKGIMGSLSDMVSSVLQGAKDAANSLLAGGKGKMAEKFLNGAEKLAGKFVSSGASRAILGSLKNSLGRPAVYAMNSLLSGEPVGLWHLTIGNPKNPIAAFGNLILTNTKITHSGPLGFDDFPTELKVTCTLKHGRSRDLSEVARMYTKGNGAFYNALDKNKLSEFFEVSNTTEGKEVETEIDMANYVRSANEGVTQLQEEERTLRNQLDQISKNLKNAQQEEAQKKAEQAKQNSDNNSSGNSISTDSHIDPESLPQNNAQAADKPTTRSATAASGTGTDNGAEKIKQLQSQQEKVKKELEKVKDRLNAAETNLKEITSNPKLNKYLTDNWSSMYGDVEELKSKMEAADKSGMKSGKNLYLDIPIKDSDRSPEDLQWGHYIRDQWALRYETLGQDLDMEARILIDENA